MKTRKHETEFRVYYEDTDAGGVMYHAGYLRFAERARTELLRESGFEQESLRTVHDAGFVVRHLSADFMKPARLDDMLRVETRIESVKRTSMCMIQSIFSQNLLLFSLQVKIACVDHTLRPRRIPEDIGKALLQYLL
jgi:acyl-CoA thioester hydrolase